jgi:hypothetical protein
VPQELLSLVAWQGSANVITLNLVAMPGFQDLELPVGFHTFSDDSEVQAISHGDYCRGDDLIFHFRGDSADERTVDFESIDRKMF